MQLIITKDFNDLKSCDGKVVGVTVTDEPIKISLRSVVPLASYKALAALGRQPGCSFDAKTKTTTIPLISKNVFTPTVVYIGMDVYEKKNPIQVMSYTPNPTHSSARAINVDAAGWDDVAMIVKLNEKGTRDLFALVQRLGREDAKTFATVKDAMAAQSSKRVSRSAQKSEDDEDYAIAEVGPFEDADHDHE